ncbi:replication-associated recombination protein A [Marinibactrum halimedae]|uniref:Replication-associated recombination protein A n=1 Tax=Marinibactrum halimedae TaxID=1444977 RepID=A0AA37T667_9GAMM|nr:replication-associated recombination protein A [Marinibactrum halimedae]MCD9460420.1 replication-associated recombination protein A [Marinibactrum halimedae]GLS27449.1 recombination factor protein RarA [Marinibactrum halimedae]
MTDDLFGDGAANNTALRAGLSQHQSQRQPQGVDAFQHGAPLRFQPLASRLRPLTLNEYCGQRHLLAEGKPLREAIERDALHSMIFWGPPGVGKTSLAKTIAELTHAHFQTLSAVLAGVKEIRAAVAEAQQVSWQQNRKTVLFVDEVHRFNKSQQDAFLPFVEDGTIIFIGATTENPSFELNNALLSRCRVYVLKALDEADLQVLLQRALSVPERGYGEENIHITEEVRQLLIKGADGDGRKLLNLLELCVDLAEESDLKGSDTQEGADGARIITEAVVREVMVADVRRFDKGGDQFYDQISALHKSVRGSHPDAALYWCMRMMDGGCDPFYVARRVVRMAVEDIGNADPRALQLAINAWETHERLGSPEGELAIAQAVVYLASAPKSNAVYSAFKQVRKDVSELPSFDVPLHLRNAPTQLMKSLDYGAEYRYAHDEPEAYAAGENYFPEALKDRQYYFPTSRGLEAKISEKLKYLKSLDENSPNKRYD